MYKHQHNLSPCRTRFPAFAKCNARNRQDAIIIALAFKKNVTSLFVCDATSIRFKVFFSTSSSPNFFFR